MPVSPTNLLILLLLLLLRVLLHVQASECFRTAAISQFVLQLPTEHPVPPGNSLWVMTTVRGGSRTTLLGSPKTPKSTTCRSMKPPSPQAHPPLPHLLLFPTCRPHYPLLPVCLPRCLLPIPSRPFLPPKHSRGMRMLTGIILHLSSCALESRMQTLRQVLALGCASVRGAMMATTSPAPTNRCCCACEVKAPRLCALRPREGQGRAGQAWRQ